MLRRGAGLVRLGAAPGGGDVHRAGGVLPAAGPVPPMHPDTCAAASGFVVAAPLWSGGDHRSRRHRSANDKDHDLQLPCKTGNSSRETVTVILASLGREQSGGLHGPTRISSILADLESHRKGRESSWGGDHGKPITTGRRFGGQRQCGGGSDRQHGGDSDAGG